MKHIKKISSLIVVLAIMLSVLSLSVVAAEPDVVPYGKVATCSSCGAAATSKTATVYGSPYADSSCTASNVPAVHHHRKDTIKHYLACPNCGEILVVTVTKYYCVTTSRYYR